MYNIKELNSGIIVYSSKGVGGLSRINVLNSNEVYKMNVWWSKLKDSLSSLDVATFTELNKSCKTCGSKLGVDCGDAEPDYDDNYCSEGCYESRNLDYC